MSRMYKEPFSTVSSPNTVIVPHVFSKPLCKAVPVVSAAYPRIRFTVSRSNLSISPESTMVLDVNISGKSVLLEMGI